TTAPVYDPTTAGVTNYYVSQLDANGCESHRDTLTIKVNAKPAAPVAQDKTYCQGVAAVALTATGASGNTILWYGTNATGGTGETTAPVPLTNAIGTTTYYVSQKDETTTCESNRDDAIVIVNATPAPPVVAAVTYCEEDAAVALTATGDSGNTVQWFVGGSTTLTAPTPNTAVAGLTMFYVSQTIPGTGCESGMSQVPVTVNPKPVATVIAVNSLCVGSVSQNNAQLILTRYRNSDEVSYNIGSTYGTPTPSTYTTVPSGGVFASNLPNPTAATQDYTVRIKNSFNCTVDRVATLTKTDCACPGGYCEPATVTKTK
ncbi:Ig-like domain-containing protein, partial [Emticicia agri]|uniref:Ig-like domain-containing protein n=1 Tax=Emticicia agri TaxID=2492393 RepID=UPI00404251DB